MIEIENSACAQCPRYIEVMHRFDHMREVQAKGASFLMDQENAQGLVAELISEFDAEIDEEEVVDMLRQGADHGFDLIDMLEGQVGSKLNEDAKHCLGKLTLRATSGSTQYEVTICRSPVQEGSSETEPALVRRKSA